MGRELNFQERSEDGPDVLESGLAELERGPWGEKMRMAGNLHDLEGQPDKTTRTASTASTPWLIIVQLGRASVVMCTSSACRKLVFITPLAKDHRCHLPKAPSPLPIRSSDFPFFSHLPLD
jgi:hypothetical protein